VSQCVCYDLLKTTVVVIKEKL